MKKLFIIVLLCSLFKISIYESFAQARGWYAPIIDNNLLADIDGFISYKTIPTEGSPLMFDTWVKADLVLKNETHRDVFININNKEGELLVMNSANDSAVFDFDESLIEELHVKNGGRDKVLKYYPSNYVKNNSGRGMFYEVIHEGDFTLLKLERKSLVLAEKEKAYSLDEPMNEYVLDETYYLRLDAMHRFQTVRMNKRVLLRAFDDRLSPQTKEIVMNRKYKLTNESDLIEFIEMVEKLSE